MELYRNEYKASQHGVIGIVLNHDWAEPLTDSVSDIAAAQRANEFKIGITIEPYYRYIFLSCKHIHFL